ncbi:Smr/MutS family protein [Paludicola sp. MB14-C6]|uniref:Smr/MutS family protein n=1 Tax=Paludihabitans sp. MB14-C6 TaxID=3070656 RepID=UPI0027DBF6BE|nr:Smr/MutS family protein [Paludicola sp. MB14-C6]WMJ23842.1 Smr/MutS family protein [Paludicola sp. MB14-C6]
MIRYITNQKAEIDIHNMQRDQAKRYIEQFLNKVNGSIREVSIIHGYSNGTVLLNMVQKGLRHPKIQSKVKSMNPGITILILK